jgi:hypothetical protein
MASGTRHILEGYKPSRTRALNLGEVHAHLLGFTPGGVCGLRLLGSLSSDGVLGLLGSLLSLLGYSSCGVLSLARHLTGLVCGLSDSLLRLSRCLSGRILHALRGLPNLIGNSAQRTSTFLSASEPADGVLHTLDGLTGLVRCLTGRVLGLLGSLLSLLGYSSCGVLSLACYLTGLIGDLSRDLLGLPGSLSSRVLRSLHGLASGPILAGPVFHLLGRLYHVADDDTSVAARALDLCEIYAPLPCLAARRIRGLDLALAPDLVRVQVGDVLLRLVDAILHGRVVVHQLLKKCLEGFLSAPRDLVRQALQRGTVVSYVLFEHLGRITEVLLGQVHRPLLDFAPGLLNALV